MAPGVEMAEQHGWMLLPESGNGSLLFCQQECQWIDVGSFGREVRVLDGRCVYSLPCAYPRIGFHSLDFSCFLTLAWQKRRLGKPAKASDFTTCSRSP